MIKIYVLGTFLVLALVLPSSELLAETPAVAPAPAVATAQTVASAPTPAPAAVVAATAVDAPTVVRNFYTQLVDVMKQGNQLGYAGRFKTLQPTIQASFNLALMTKIAVGSAWIKATESEQKQLITAFSDFSVANYASQFKSYDDELFTVLGSKSVPNGVIVETKLQPKTGDSVALDYLMQQDEQGAWRIVDVYLNGSISELAARRSEFTSIARRDGIPALVNSLDEKSKQMGPS